MRSKFANPYISFSKNMRIHKIYITSYFYTIQLFISKTPRNYVRKLKDFMTRRESHSSLKLVHPKVNQKVTRWGMNSDT